MVKSTKVLFCLLFDSKYIQDSTIEKSYVHKHKHYQQYASQIDLIPISVIASAEYITKVRLLKTM